MSEWTRDDWRECEHREYRSGQRTFGANIPGYAQGAIFPGDESGNVCKLSGEFCESMPSEQECPRCT